MSRELAKDLIVKIAKGCDYDAEGEGTAEILLYLKRRDFHIDNFLVRHTNHTFSEDWLQTHTNHNNEEDGSAALYPLRNMAEVVSFCQTLIAIYQIKINSCMTQNQIPIIA